ncbi:MAG: baseplate J/gp47 family protein [Betaproteobacteria bacterium]|nr:baseplate J/gp47 family protein [Betaproteobacteria bacterium]
MTTPNTQSFSQIVSNMVTAIQGAVTTLVDTTIGSILRAVVEADAAVVLWLQGLILQLLAITRAASSNTTDLDSWMADYGITRLPAVAATGAVTFSRFTATLQAVVPVGATVQTADGSQNYTVNLDTTNPAYSASLGGYVLTPGTASVTVNVTAVTAGSAGNAAPGFINTITTAIVGVDTVTNALQFTAGVDTETDSALRVRFVNYIASLSKATKAAISYAITSIQTGVNFVLTENLTYAGAAQLDYFYVVVDDGSGSPPGSFITAVSNAIDAVRPVTSTFGVYAPVVVTANVAMTITTGSGYVHATVATAVQAALQAYIDALPIGATLPYTQLAAVAYGVGGVTNVSVITLNSGTADLTATQQQVIKAGTVTVS